MWYTPNSDPDIVSRKGICEYTCWSYGLFGDETVCDAGDDGWGSFQEPVVEGQKCLYPNKKDTSPPDLIVTMNGLCAALTGGVIVGGRDDNTQLVNTLIGSKSGKD